METSCNWLDELETNFDDAYVNLDTALEDLYAKARRNELNNHILFQIIENSKEKLKQISYIWSGLMEKSQCMHKKQKTNEIEIAALKSLVAEDRSRDEEFEKLIKILDTASFQINCLKKFMPKRQEDQTNIKIQTDSSNNKRNENESNQTLKKELISEHNDRNVNDLNEPTYHETMNSNIFFNDLENQLNEKVSLHENYGFNGSTQVIPSGSVNLELLDPRLKAKLVSSNKKIPKKEVILQLIKYETDDVKISSQTSFLPANDNHNNFQQSKTTLTPAPIQSILPIIQQSHLVKYNEPTQNTQNLLSSLALNLNLPPSISSILFKKNFSENEDQKLLNSNEKILERPTDPRQHCNNLPKIVKVSPFNQALILNDPSKNENSTKNKNPVFDKIQNILTNGVKPANLNQIQNNSRKKYVTAENDRFVIKRLKPLEKFNEESPIIAKSQLVELYEKEVKPEENRSELMILRFNKKNSALEKMIKTRNDVKIENLKVFYETNKSQLEVYEMFEDFISECDLVKSLNHLMNYDFCNNKYNPNKKNRKKKKKREKLNIDLFDIDNFREESTNNKKSDADEDILYGDINDFDNDAAFMNNMKLYEETSLACSELISKQSEDEDGELLDSDKEMGTLKKQKISSQPSSLTFSKSQKENKHTSKVLKQEEKSKKSSRSSSPRRIIDGSPRYRSSRSDSKRRSENSRRSRSISRSRQKSKDVKTAIKSSVDYTTKKAETSHCTKLTETNKDKPLKQSQEVNKNFKRKRYD